MKWISQLKNTKLTRCEKKKLTRKQHAFLLKLVAVSRESAELFSKVPSAKLKAYDVIPTAEETDNELD